MASATAEQSHPRNRAQCREQRKFIGALASSRVNVILAAWRPRFCGRLRQTNGQYHRCRKNNCQPRARPRPIIAGCGNQSSAVDAPRNTLLPLTAGIFLSWNLPPLSAPPHPVTRNCARSYAISLPFYRDLARSFQGKQPVDFLARRGNERVEVNHSILVERKRPRIPSFYRLAVLVEFLWQIQIDHYRVIRFNSS